MKHWRKYAATASPVVAPNINNTKSCSTNNYVTVYVEIISRPIFFLSLDLNYTSLMFERLQEKARGPFHPATCG